MFGRYSDVQRFLISVDEFSASKLSEKLKKTV